MALKIPKFETKNEQFAFLKKNVITLIAQKKARMKKAKNGFNNPILSIEKFEKVKAKKNAGSSEQNDEYIIVKAVISTTNIRDSHKDVHLPNWAKKSIKENKSIMHVQEHKMQEFSKIISDGEDLEVYTENFKWKDLGFDFEGKTEALIFRSKVRRERNPEMYKNYTKGWVKNHSVGMVYMKIFLAIDSKEEDYKEEKANFDKYIDTIANKEEVVKDGYYWGVSEAKVIEGSSVPAGSNFATPTISGKQKSKKKKNKKPKKSARLKAVEKFLKIK
tara:strand:+ start:2643 stop:3467 length:825 start_codon:yes stop_codon:yes gene_type:complete